MLRTSCWTSGSDHGRLNVTGRRGQRGQRQSPTGERRVIVAIPGTRAHYCDVSTLHPSPAPLDCWWIIGIPGTELRPWTRYELTREPMYTSRPSAPPHAILVGPTMISRS